MKPDIDTVWEVTFYPTNAINKWIASQGDDYEEEYEGRVPAMEQCEEFRNFPNLGLARAYAKRVAPLDDYKMATIRKMVKEPVEGCPGLFDWEQVGEVEEVEAP